MKLIFRKEFKIGVLVFMTLAIFFWGLNYLKNSNVFTKHRTFYAIYDQVNGLTSSAPIFIKGFKVGTVKDVYFMSDGSNRIIVKMQLSNDIPVPIASIAKIYSSDLMGSKAVEIILGKSPNFAKDEDTLSNQLQASLAEEVSIQMLPIKRKAESLLTSIDSVLIMVQYVFNENTRMNLSKSFENIKIAIDNLKNTTFNIDTLVSTQRNRLSHIIGDVESIASNIEKNNEKITTILSNFSIISDSLAKSNIKQTIENANKVISNVSNVFDKINNGKGTLGLLVNNDTLYNQINNAAANLDKLLIDIKSNPSRYIKISVFGKNQEK